MIDYSKHERRLKNERDQKLKRRRICYFVYGNEGSGTRLVHRIISSDPFVYTDGNPGFVGARKMRNFGQAAHKHDKIALKRDGGWSPPINLPKVSGDIRKHYTLYWVWTMRRPAKFELAGKIQRFNEYLSAVAANDLFCFWDNSLMFVDPGNFLREMELTLNLNFSGFTEEIKNPDIKYLKYWGILREDK